jgi:hypothetical protein
MIFRDSKKNGVRQVFVFVYLLSLLSIGIGYLSIIPAFEGFDEQAHYSSIRQIADTRTIPLSGASYIDQGFIDYKGPLPYDTGTPPFDNGMVYPKFFASADLVKNYQQTYRQEMPQSVFRPSDTSNWEAQHPPLYYLLMAPVMKLLDGFSFTTQFFLLRLVSYILALCGVAFGLLSVNKPNIPPERNPAMIGFLLYPIIFPMFFPEFTRIGNDSLCLLLAGLVAYLLSLWLKDEQNTKLPVAIGIALGVGLLTKALFIPITVCLLVFLLTRLLLDTENKSMQSLRLGKLLQIFLLAMFIGGGWYVYKFVVFGTITGANVGSMSIGQIIFGLKEHSSLYGWVRSVLTPLVSYSWAGTWSLTRLPEFLHFPLLAVACWIVISYFRQLKHQAITTAEWLPVWLFFFFGCGLLWHLTLNIAATGNGVTPGWYLHILIPWAAPAIGMGISSILQHRREYQYLVILILYAVLYQAMAVWAHLALYTGCAIKGDDKLFVFSGHSFCLDQTSLIMDRISVLGYPGLAVIGFAGGLVCFLWLLVQVWRSRFCIHTV